MINRPAPHSQHAQPAQFAGFSAFTLKLVAILGMTCNHAAYIFQPLIPFAAQCVLFAVGGVTFPIMAYLLVEGYTHTSNVKKYATRLAVFAAISQVPYWLFLDHNGNVIITLLLCLIALQLYDALRNRMLFWISFAAIVVVSFWCDWGVLGPIMVLMFYVLRKNADCQKAKRQEIDRRETKHQGADLLSVDPQNADFRKASSRTTVMALHGSKARRESIIRTMLVPITADGLVCGFEMLRNIAMLPHFLYAAVGNTAAMILLLCYNGERGRPLKWFFYAYYPLHIAVLGVAATFIL